MPGVLTRKMRTPRGKLAAAAPPSTTTATTTTKLSKLQPAGKESLSTPAPIFTAGHKIEVVLRSRKRKDHDEEDKQATPKKLCRQPEVPVQPVAPATPSSSREKKAVRFAAFEPAVGTSGRAAPTPSSSSRKRQLESDDSETETETLLQRLNLSSPAAKRNKTTVHRRAPANDFDLPKELNDLLDLHAAFLKTLTVQRAHTGPASPIDLRALYTSVTRAWGKRHVMLDDIRRCIGVLAWTPVKKASDLPTASAAPFFLTDYGRDKICVEFDPSTSAGPLREPKLKMDFEANLRTLWLSSGNLPATIFIGTLPKAPLRACHARGAHPVLSTQKNQTTLDAFKRDLAEKKQQKEQAKQPTPTPAAIENKGLTLLERVRLKESTLSTTPQPTPAALQRISSLHRAADVAAVISMLARAAGPSAPRVSFALPALAARLRDSVRTPVSLEDGAACVRLLASEVVPGWVRVVKVGGRESVVVMMAGEVSKAVVEERVAKLLG